MTKSQYETFSVLDISFCNWIFLFWNLLCMSFYDCILFSPEKTSKYALKPEETVKKLLLCLLPLYDPQWAFLFSPTSTLSLNKQSCILKFSLVLLSALLTKKYDLEPKLIFFLLSCSTFLGLTADTIIYRKSDFAFVLPMKIWKKPLKSRILY